MLEGPQRIEAPIPLDLRRIAIIVSFGVGHKPVGVDAQETRLRLRAHVLHGIGRSFKQAIEGPGVSHEAMNAERLCPLADIACQGLALRRTLRVEIIFQRDQQGQLPLGSDVERFVHHAFAQRAIANEDSDDVASFGQLLRQRQPRRHRYDTALYPIAEDALRANVLASAATPAYSGLTAHDFRHQAVDIAGARQKVSVAAMVGEN